MHGKVFVMVKLSSAGDAFEGGSAGVDRVEQALQAARSDLAKQHRRLAVLSNDLFGQEDAAVAVHFRSDYHEIRALYLARERLRATAAHVARVQLEVVPARRRERRELRFVPVQSPDEQNAHRVLQYIV